VPIEEGEKYNKNCTLKINSFYSEILSLLSAPTADLWK
jgi:hypothetical protein